MSAIVPLPSGDMTILQDASPAGKVIIQFKGSTTVISGSETTIAGHTLQFGNGNAVTVDGQSAIQLHPAVSTAIVPLGQDFVTVVNNLLSPGENKVVF
jgi:hypothetical protein